MNNDTRIFVDGFLSAVYEKYKVPMVNERILDHDNSFNRKPTRRTIEAATLLMDLPGYSTLPLTSGITKYYSDVVYSLSPGDLESDKLIHDILRDLRNLIDDDIKSPSRGIVMITLKDQKLKIPCEMGFFKYKDDSYQIWKMYKMANAYINIEPHLIEKVEIAVLTSPRSFIREVKLQANATANLLGQQYEEFNPSVI